MANTFKVKKLVFLVATFISIHSLCRGASQSSKKQLLSSQEKKEFSNYWNKGKAEINRYSLMQSRYGKNHKGDVVLIFVTEDFLTDKIVKNETHQSKNTTQVLKLNVNRKFITGIYDYSLMTSVFSPVDIMNYEHALKVSASSQEWCGHVYSQLIKDGDEYEFTSHSYFEKEVFQNYDLRSTLLEDEIMTQIRISPDSLPLGAIKVIPSVLDSRLRHYKLSVEEARADKFPSKDIAFLGKKVIEYRVRYINIDRVFRVIYENQFPYLIMGFIEEIGVDSYTTGKPSDVPQRKMLTKAIRTHTIMSKYWNKHRPEDKHLRKKLGL